MVATNRFPAGALAPSSSCSRCKNPPPYPLTPPTLRWKNKHTSRAPNRLRSPRATTNQHPQCSPSRLYNIASLLCLRPRSPLPKPPGGDVSDVMQRDTRRPSSSFAPRPKLKFCCAATLVDFFYAKPLIIVNYLLFDLTELAKAGDFVFAYLSVACCCADKAIHNWVCSPVKYQA